MALINIPDVQNLDPATPASLNSRFGLIADEINGNLDTNNIATGGVGAANLASSSVTTAKVADAAVTPPKWSNPYKFRAYRNAAATTGNGAYAIVACDTEVFDSNNNHAAGVYTAPVTGYYFFGGEAHVNMASENRVCILGLFKNGTQVALGNEIFGATGTNTGITVSDFMFLTAGDTVDMRVFCSATKNLNVAATQNYFYGFLVSET